MDKLKLCQTCDRKGCDFKDSGKDFVCSRGYILTTEDKHRILSESYAEAVRNGEITNE
jgi:hypothetical protein